MTAANEKTVLLQDDMMVEMAKLKKIKDMQRKIEEASLSNGFKTVIPDYDNMENVIPIFLGYKVDKEETGIKIEVL